MVNKAWYSSGDIADITGFSLRWVVKWRRKIAGAKQFGREWRFSKEIVDRRIATGQDLRIGI